MEAFVVSLLKVSVRNAKQPKVAFAAAYASARREV